MPPGYRLTFQCTGSRSVGIGGRGRSAAVPKARRVQVQLTVLAVPGGPNARMLEQRLGRPPGRRAGGSPAPGGEVREGAGGARGGARGAGQDRFGEPGSAAVLACRLYPAGEGRLDGAPTVSALRDVLERAGAQG